MKIKIVLLEIVVFLSVVYLSFCNSYSHFEAIKIDSEIAMVINKDKE